MKELLLLLSQYPFDAKNRDTLSTLIGEVKDWPTMLKLINAHGITALAAYNIKEAGLGKEITAEAMAALENGYFKNISRNTWLTECWKEVNNILSDVDIRHILLKGMALEHTLYGSRGLRQMSDNDILIKPEESVKAWKLLQQHGFTPEPLKSCLFKKIMFDFGHHLPVLYKNGYALEIHDNLFNQRITEETTYRDPFSEAEEILISETKAYILNKELQMRYLTTHFKHHAASGDCQLRLYADIVLLDKSNHLQFSSRFILEPLQGTKKEFRKAAYKARIRSIQPKYRLRFLLGDTYPSLKWMKERYKCNGLKVLFIYPLRSGKLWWLF
jgi:hypothetical protein